MSSVYEQLAANIDEPQSKIIPRLFALIADEKEAKLLVAMPGTIPDLAEKTGIDAKEIEKMIKLLFYKGLVFYSKKTDPYTWRMCRSMGQFHDASILWPDAPQEFLDLWKEYQDTEWYDRARTLREESPIPGTRIMPINKWVDSKSQVLAFEDVSRIVEKARRLAVVKCTCRLAAQKCDAPLETCIQLDRAADYAMERGTGREIDKKEAMDITRRCEQAGLIHLTGNRKDVDIIICNCCGCCCVDMTAIQHIGSGYVAPSRFRADVDAEACIGCGVCEDTCSFGAISVGDDSVAEVNAETCIGCGVCARECLEEAIHLIEVRNPDYVPD